MGCFHQGLRNGNLKLRDHDLGAYKNLSTEGAPSGYIPREQQRSPRPTDNRIGITAGATPNKALRLFVVRLPLRPTAP